MPFAARVVGGFLRKHKGYRYLEDDLVSAGHLALVILCNALKPEMECDFEGVARQKIREAIREAIAIEQPIPVAVRTAARERAKGTPIEFTRIAERKLDKHKHYADHLRAYLDCCVDDIDEQIVRLRAGYMTDEEIATELGLSRSAVGRRREAIEARYEADS